MSNYADEKPRPNKTYVALKKPKYSKEISLEESAKFQPWKVDLKVEIDVGSDKPETIPYTIFLRAKDPSEVQYLAYMIFTTLERIRPGIPDYKKYPCIASGQENASECEKLTEDQYMSFWKEAQFYPHASSGFKDNPSFFRFDTSGKSVKKTIVSPDLFTIKKVEKTKR